MGLSNLTKKFLICAFSLCTVSSFAQEVKEEGKVVFNLIGLCKFKAVPAILWVKLVSRI